MLAGLGTPVLGLAGDLNIDGSIGSRTALLRQPYADAPGDAAEPDTSPWTQVADHLAATLRAGHPGRFPPDRRRRHGHCGAKACERAAARVGIAKVRAAGHRFEHAEMADTAAIAALAEHSVTVIRPAGV